jgi:hypothetical protein
MSHLLSIFALSALCAGWVAVQLLAKKLGTKNHIDNAGDCCGGCSCSNGCKKS